MTTYESSSSAEARYRAAQAAGSPPEVLAIIEREYQAAADREAPGEAAPERRSAPKSPPEKAAPPAPKKPRSRTAKPRNSKPSYSSIPYHFGGTPIVIMNDPHLSSNAKVAAGLIAEKLFNFPASGSRHRETSYSEIARALGSTMPTAIAAVRQLTNPETRKRQEGREKPAYLRLVKLGTGRRGNLYAFTAAVALRKTA